LGKSSCLQWHHFGRHFDKIWRFFHKTFGHNDRHFFFSTGPTILLPPILTTANANTWLSTRCQLKRTQSGSGRNKNEDLTKWLASQTETLRSEGAEVRSKVQIPEAHS
jgi:hypothetical protein